MNYQELALEAMSRPEVVQASDCCSNNRQALTAAILQCIDECRQQHGPNGVTKWRVYGRLRDKELGFAFPWFQVLLWLIPRLIRWWFSDAGERARSKQ